MILVEVTDVNVLNDSLRIHSPSQSGSGIRGELDCLGSRVGRDADPQMAGNGEPVSSEHSYLKTSLGQEAGGVASSCVSAQAESDAVSRCRGDLRRPNTEISSEDRVILASAGFVCFISLLDGASFGLPG